MVKTYTLCPKLCGLEKTTKSCFSYHLHRCLGACVQEEEFSQYNLRVQEAILEFQEDPWPFTGAIAIKENQTETSNWLIFDNWQFLGQTPCESEWSKFCSNPPPEPTDRDTYKILRGYLQKNLIDLKLCLIPMGSGT